jgi:hypothetical protein
LVALRKKKNFCDFVLNLKVAWFDCTNAKNIMSLTFNQHVSFQLYYISYLSPAERDLKWLKNYLSKV